MKKVTPPKPVVLGGRCDSCYKEHDRRVLEQLSRSAEDLKGIYDRFDSHPSGTLTYVQGEKYGQRCDYDGEMPDTYFFGPHFIGLKHEIVGINRRNDMPLSLTVGFAYVVELERPPYTYEKGVEGPLKEHISGEFIPACILDIFSRDEVQFGLESIQREIEMKIKAKHIWGFNLESYLDSVQQSILTDPTSPFRNQMVLKQLLPAKQ